MGRENPLKKLKVLTGSSNCVEKTTPNQRCLIRVHVMKLPSMLTKVLHEISDILGTLLEGKPRQIDKTSTLQKGNNGVVDDSPIEVFKQRIVDAIESEIKSGSKAIDSDRAEKYISIWHPEVESEDASVLIPGSSHASETLRFMGEHGTQSNENSSKAISSLNMEDKSLQNSGIGVPISLAANLDPCDEPMWGLAFLVEAYISPLGGSDLMSPEPFTDLSDQRWHIHITDYDCVKDTCKSR
ncbi:hypothetical protein IFM89_011336 [Coptis chinensis]|uniref:Uncharacterized protein n=1 Tax=Coptis chinensis TaxID=261450 RepID=A0A835IVP2_9MAGN|nr:hypothetical protein IFM89_011336 [Coptis chinensis]